MTDLEGVRSVYRFLFDEFPAWKLAPLHSHYSHNAFGRGGEIKHIPYVEVTYKTTGKCGTAVRWKRVYRGSGPARS